MSVLKAFLQPPATNETKEVFIDRFKDEEGKVIPFKIRRISQSENEALGKQSQKREKVDGQIQIRMDNVEYSHRLVLACVVEPNLSDAELCAYYGVVDPKAALGNMFTAGEYGQLISAIQEFNGFGGAKEIKEIEEEAKN